MAYISRQDGKHFVVPSYRDILSAKKPALLKKEILLLSANYGNFITLQRKNIDQYEATFASEAGYLLGESVWSNFKQPVDLIYCEAIPDTSEALLVIVKSDSVYLDGSFPIDSIADELVVFLTQAGNFEIYIHGDVPISEEPAEGKFSLSPESVKSFTILAEPLFQTLPTLKEYLLTPADKLLKAKGIGVLPVKKIAVALSIPVILAGGYIYFSTHKEAAPQFLVSTIDPWKNYYNTLNSTPSPDIELQNMLGQIALLFNAPGWKPGDIIYASGSLSSKMTSLGMNMAPLFAWAKANNISLNLSIAGTFINESIKTPNRTVVRSYSAMEQVLADFIDKISRTWLGMIVAIGESHSNGPYKTTTITVQFEGASLQSLGILATQLHNIPVIFKKAVFSPPTDAGEFSGTLTFQALGK